MSFTTLMYHTQEKRENRLTAPIICEKDNAWLGAGYYFWYYEIDAHFWGRVSKKRTGAYEIYTTVINRDNVLDTVFNEAHYQLWFFNIDRIIKKIAKKSSEKITLKLLNDRLKECGVLDSVDGVLFEQISDSESDWFLETFQYRKQIQLAVYNLNIVSNFTFLTEGQS
jgi:hypothetical protein